MTGLQNKLLLWLLTFGLLFNIVQATAMAIDYGQEWTKQAVVKHGAPLDVVLTKDSKRKQQSVIAFRNDQRLYGTDAANMASRFPQTVYKSLKSLAGKTLDLVEVEEFQSKNPLLSVIEQLERPAVSISRGEDYFTIEELIAMQFANSKALADDSIKGSVKNVVVTVPPFFSQSERQAIIDAVHLSGLKLLGLINDGSAIALNYANSRTWEPEERYHMIYDMGAGSTSATLVSIKTIGDDEVGKSTKPAVVVDVLGTGWDRSLGGDILTDHLTEIFIIKFEELHGKQVGVPIRDSPKALSKLRKEALRVKQILSANQEVTASVESLHEDVDFKAKITRSEFEDTFSELASRVVAPVDQALDIAKISLSEIDSVLLAGGSTRVPWIQKKLEEHVGESKISKNINADEAAVLGAVFRAAVLSGQFKTKDVRITDKVQYDVSLTHNLDNGQKSTEQVFTLSTNLGTSKSSSLEKDKDFTFSLIETFSQSELLTTNVTGITGAMQKIGRENTTLSTVVDITIEINQSGILEVSNVTLTCETSAESGFSDAVKSMFGLQVKDKKTSTTAETPEATLGNEMEKTEDVGTESVTRITVPLKWSSENRPIRALNAAEKKVSSTRLRDLEKKDKQIVDREDARNALEGYLYRVREYIDDSGFTQATTTEVLEIFKQKVDDASDWISIKGDEASLTELRNYLKTLTDIESPISIRKSENEKRPEALGRLKESLKSAKGYFETLIETSREAAEKAAAEELSSLKDGVSKQVSTTSLPESSPSLLSPLVDVEHLMSAIEKVDKMQKSLDEKIEKQDVLKQYEDPILTIKEIEKQAEQIQKLLLDSLMKSMKKPPPKKAPVSSSKAPESTSPPKDSHDEL